MPKNKKTPSTIDELKKNNPELFKGGKERLKKFNSNPADYKAASGKRDSKAQADAIWKQQIQPDEKQPPKKVAILYAANQNQAEAIIAGYENKTVPEITGGGQAPLFNELGKKIGNQDVHILPVATTLAGGNITIRNHVTLEMMNKQLANIAWHLANGYEVIGLKSSTSENFALGGKNSKNWYATDPIWIIEDKNGNYTLHTSPPDNPMTRVNAGETKLSQGQYMQGQLDMLSNVPFELWPVDIQNAALAAEPPTAEVSAPKTAPIAPASAPSPAPAAAVPATPTPEQKLDEVQKIIKTKPGYQATASLDSNNGTIHLDINVEHVEQKAPDSTDSTLKFSMKPTENQAMVHIRDLAVAGVDTITITGVKSPPFDQNTFVANLTNTAKTRNITLDVTDTSPSTGTYSFRVQPKPANIKAPTGGIITPAPAPVTFDRSTMTTSDNFKAIQDALAKSTDPKGWTAEQKQPNQPIVVKDSKQTEKFTITPAQIETNIDDLQTFKAMLICFKAANPGKLPTITAFSDASKKLWQDAVNVVYKNEVASGATINITKITTPSASAPQPAAAPPPPPPPPSPGGSGS